MPDDGQVCILGFIHPTLFPDDSVTLLVIDERMPTDMKQTLKEHGIELAVVPQSKQLQPCVSAHPDMQLVHIRDNILISHPHLSPVLQEKLEGYGFTVIAGTTALKAEYPFDIAYNVAIIGKVAFHHLRYTDDVVARYLKKCSIRTVHVNQGYAKCSILPVTPESLITSDPTIARAAAENGFDVLFLPPQTKIRLPGVNYGFIGGTGGFIDKDLIVFTGTLEALNDAEAVKTFLMKHGVRWHNLGNNELYDYGGLLPLYI
jgi:hypothetical protein